MTEEIESEVPSYEDMGVAGITLINFCNLIHDRVERREILKHNIISIISLVEMTDEERKVLLQDIAWDLFGR